jgi:hypothetical protein
LRQSCKKKREKLEHLAMLGTSEEDATGRICAAILSFPKLEIL